MKIDKKCKILNFKSGKGCYWVMILDTYTHLNIINLHFFAEEKELLYLSKYHIILYSAASTNKDRSIMQCIGQYSDINMVEHND